MQRRASPRPTDDSHPVEPLPHHLEFIVNRLDPAPGHARQTARGSVPASKMPHQPTDTAPALDVRDGGLRPALEAALAAVLLVAVLPVLGAAALLIKLTSPGPVIYTQSRVGLGGRRFTLYKLRT